MQNSTVSDQPNAFASPVIESGRIAASLSDTGAVDAKIVEGHAAEQICLWAADHAAELVVLGAHGEGRLTDEGRIAEQNVDLVILSAHGHSGRTDAPSGSVTAHLIGHSPVPLLIVRDRLPAVAQPGNNANFTGAEVANLCLQ